MSFFVLILLVTSYLHYSYQLPVSNDLDSSSRNYPVGVDESIENISLNICCDPNELLNERFQCEKFEGGNFPDKGVGILDSLALDDNFIRSSIERARVSVRFKESIDFFMSGYERFVVHWNLSYPTLHYISQRDGSLLELASDRKTIVAKFSTKSYCLDQIKTPGREYVALVKPCMETICIQKCCRKGSYFDSATFKCQPQTVNHSTTYPVFFNGTVPTLRNISYYFIEGTPKCDGPDFRINNDTLAPIYIQESGYLMTMEHQTKNSLHYYEKDKYCVDAFGDGDSTFFNGFYCFNETLLQFPEERMIKSQELDLIDKIKKESDKMTRMFSSTQNISPSSVTIISVIIFLICASCALIFYQS